MPLPESIRASRQQVILANLVAQISALQDVLNVLSAQHHFRPSSTETALIQLVSARMNETAATAYFLNKTWQERSEDEHE